MQAIHLKPIGITLLVSFMLAFSACKKTDEEKLIGKWERVCLEGDTKGLKDTITFDATKFSGIIDGEKRTAYYYIEGEDQLLLNAGNNKYWYVTFQFTSNKEMQWSFNTISEKYQLTKL